MAESPFQITSLPPAARDNHELHVGILATQDWRLDCDKNVQCLLQVNLRNVHRQGPITCQFECHARS